MTTPSTLIIPTIPTESYKCSMCLKSMVSSESISIRIPGGIRGCGRPHQIYVCDEICKKKYQNTKMCQICNCSDLFVVINGKSVCSDDIYWIDHPTCLEQYTGTYKCYFCEKTKDIIDDICYIIHDNINGESMNMCEKCYEPYVNIYNEYDYMNINERWRKIYESVHKPVYDMIINKSKHNKFVCNKCNMIKATEFNINIVDNMNLCNECVTNV